MNELCMCLVSKPTIIQAVMTQKFPFYFLRHVNSKFELSCEIRNRLHVNYI